MTRRIIGQFTSLYLAIVMGLIFFWSPVEESMGIVQKIMYIHVPSILTTYVALTVSLICSIGYLWKRKELLDIIAYSATEIGAIFCGLALATGSIWGKPTWNTYWTWDARLTLTLVLFLIFVGYLLLRKFTDPGEQQARLCAIVAIIGALDIPLIHLSVVWWRTLHQQSTIMSPGGPAIDVPLLIMLILSLGACILLFAYLLLSRIELEQKHRLYMQKIVDLF